MDVFTALSPNHEYSDIELQLIVAAWVLAAAFERKAKVSVTNGHVEETDYDKRSIYAMIYALYRCVGETRNEHGEPYEFAFTTWGYTWPPAWRGKATTDTDPQRFGKNAYTGIFHFDIVQEYLAARGGNVHVVEMGCGTGAGAFHVVTKVLPGSTYEAIDMQEAAILTCKRKFIPQATGRLRATRADCTALPSDDRVADIVAVCETHVAEMVGHATEHDRKFFATAHRLLKPGGLLVWSNAIPDSTWEPCFEVLESLGMKRIEVCDLTQEAIAARDQDRRRAEAYVDEVLERLWALKLPVLGARRRAEARQAMLNFFRNPGTNLYETMTTRTDTYKVACFQKPS
jgi:ubiquinone/menaquinone biosynthesis C-methylase UbiE